MMQAEEPWLTQAEQHAWRSYLRVSRHLEVRLDNEWHRVGLSFAEYELTSVDGGRT